jgi:hypothetical protein
VTGTQGTAGIAFALVVAFLITWDVQRRREPWQLGMIAGLVFFFTLIASGRVQYGINFATQSRYVYVGVVFLLPLLAHALSGMPWRGLWRPVIFAALALCIVANAVQLQAAAVSLRGYMQVVNAELQTAEVFRGAPDMAVTRFIDDTVISAMPANTYFQAISELGSPVPPATIATLGYAPAFAVDRVMVNLFGDALRFEIGNQPVQGMTCRDVDSTSGSTMDFKVPNGGSVVLQSAKGGVALLSLGFETLPRDPIQNVQLPPATAAWVHVPDTGKPIVWQLRVTTGAIGIVRACASNPDIAIGSGRS